MTDHDDNYRVITESNSKLRFIINGKMEESGILLIDWCRQFVSSDRCVIDVGACTGAFSMKLAPHCQRVYSYEPNRDSYYALCGAIVLNGLTGTIYAYNMALGSLEQHGRRYNLYIPNGATSSTMIEVDCDRVERASVQSLDEIGLRNIGFMKVDTNGMELDVLLGAAQTIQESRPNILIRSTRATEQMVILLTELNYTVSIVDGSPNYYLARSTI